MRRMPIRHERIVANEMDRALNIDVGLRVERGGYSCAMSLIKA